MPKDTFASVLHVVRVRMRMTQERVWQQLRGRTQIKMTLSAFDAMEQGHKEIPCNILVPWYEILGLSKDDFDHCVHQMKRIEEMLRGKTSQEIARELLKEVEFYKYKLEQEEKEDDEEEQGDEADH